MILDAALAAEPAAAVPATVALGAAGVVAELAGWMPRTCCSELNRLPKRLCAVPAGMGAAVVLEDSVVGSKGEAFLWPWPWPCEGRFTAGRAGVAAVGMVSADMGLSF